MPLFRRKDTNLVDHALSSVREAAAAASDDADTDAAAAERRSYTAPKGRETPKRVTTTRRAPDPPPANRREAYRQQRDRQRSERAEATAGMRRGDERFLLPRDKGPERALVRDIVDSRRTIGTWFFGGALIVLLGSSTYMPKIVQLASNAVWLALALGVILNSVLIARRIAREVRERFPETDQKMGSLYLYGIMRGLTFRRMRIPKPRIKFGEPY